jgi:HEAT repeat protein
MTTVTVMLATGPDIAADQSRGALQVAALEWPVLRFPGQHELSSPSNFVATEDPRSGVVGLAEQDGPSHVETGATGKVIFLTQAHNSHFDRFEAIATLGTSHDAMAEMALVSLLYDPDPAIRESVVESLASIGTQGAIQGLGFALMDVSPLVRQSALEYLVEIGTPDALEALVTTLSDPEADLRLATVYELATVDSEAATGLLQLFLSDTNLTVRNTAAELLNDQARWETPER